MVPAVSDRIPRVPPYSGGRRIRLAFPYQTVTVFGVTFQTLPVRSPSRLPAPTTPQPPQRPRFGLFPFRSPLLWKSMFSFSSCRYLDVSVPCVGPSYACVQTSSARVAPFGHLRIKTCLQFPAAFRSLPRPSSPVEALGILRSLFFASFFFSYSSKQSTYK